MFILYTFTNMMKSLDLRYRYRPPLASIVATRVEHHLEGSWMGILEPARVKGATYAWLSSHLASLAANAVDPCEVASSVRIGGALYSYALRVCPIDKAPDLQLNTTEYSTFMWSLYRHLSSLRQQMTMAQVPTLINNAAATPDGPSLFWNAFTTGSA